MVLAMHVVGHGAAERHEFRPRRDRQKPALRHGDAQDSVEAQSCLGADDAALPIGAENTVEPMHADQRPAAIETKVAIGAAEPECN
jgi:hypothetical protein